MKLYTVRVTQPAKTYFEGELTINAKDEQSAIKKVKRLTQRQLDARTDWSGLTDDQGADPCGKIEVHNIINEQ